MLYKRENWKILLGKGGTIGNIGNMEKKPMKNVMEKTCKKCGKKWVSRTLFPKQCPGCRSKRWFRDAKIRGVNPEFNVRTIKPGERRLYAWSKDEEKNHRLNKSIYKEQAKKTGLRAWATHDGIWVEWNKF